MQSPIDLKQTAGRVADSVKHKLELKEMSLEVLVEARLQVLGDARAPGRFELIWQNGDRTLWQRNPPTPEPQAGNKAG